MERITKSHARASWLPALVLEGLRNAGAGVRCRLRQAAPEIGRFPAALKIDELSLGPVARLESIPRRVKREGRASEPDHVGNLDWLRSICRGQTGRGEQVRPCHIFLPVVQSQDGLEAEGGFQVLEACQVGEQRAGAGA